MNKGRRKRLAAALSLLESAMEIISQAKDEEREALDNLPVSLQQSDRGQVMEEAISVMDDVEASIDEMRDRLSDVISG